jgi:hypothetical protein
MASLGVEQGLLRGTE